MFKDVLIFFGSRFRGIQQGYKYGDYLSMIGNLFLLAVILLAVFLFLSVLWRIGKAIGRKVYWIRHREHCIHCNRWTTARSFVNNASNCHVGAACCGDCQVIHRADAEPRFLCPVDGVQMNKRVKARLISDTCPGCGYTLLAEDELNELLRRANMAGYNQGESDGMLTGGIIGYSIGQIGN